jgi:segregation and condensation protein B
MRNLRSLIEAALYMSNEPVSVEQMSKMFKADKEKIKEAVDELKKEMEDSGHGIYVLETTQGFQIRVKPQYAKSVRKLTPYKDLGRGLLRVLALVAYKQPITQAEIVKVIGNRTYEYVKVLTERGLIKAIKQSRTKALVPTKEFANYFGLENPEDVKKFFEDMEVEAKEIEEDEKELDSEETESGSS